MKKSEEQQGHGIKDFFSLLWLNFVVFTRNLCEFIKIAFKYYSNFSFLKADVSLLLMYLFHNPFSISKRFLKKKGEKEVHAYGETPLTTLEMIAEECNISPTDRVFELGCGRGRTCFWLNSFIGCNVVGIDFVPEFIERAKRIQSRLGIKGVQFRLGDFCEADFNGATVFYLYGTCLDDETIKALIEKFSKMPVGTKIITVSYPLTDYEEKPCFEVLKRFTATFTWGEADVFLNAVHNTSIIRL